MTNSKLRAKKIINIINKFLKRAHKIEQAKNKILAKI